MKPIPLALALAASAWALNAVAAPSVAIENTRVEACSFAGFTTNTTDVGVCLTRPGEFPGSGIRIDNSATAGPFPDPRGSAKVAQAVSNTHAQFGVLRIDDLAGGLNGAGALRDAMATSRASFSDVLTFRAPASMSTADFRATVANLNFGFSASVSPWLNASVELHAFGRQADSFSGNFRPGSGTTLAVADADGEHRDLFPDRSLHLSLDNGTSDRFVKFAITIDLSGIASRLEGSAEATAWLGSITFSRSAALGSFVAGAVASSTDALAGITVTAASSEIVLDPVTGQIGYLAAAAVPEPASLGLFGVGLALLACRRRAAGAAA